MIRASLSVLAILASMGQIAEAQFNGVGAGSTPQGDYLRGVGAAAYGVGLFELEEAQANAINVNTQILWNEYFTSYFAREQQAQAAAREARWRKEEQERKAIRNRIKNEPEERDVQTGSALNDALNDLLSPRIEDSSFRLARVTLSADVVRVIPFRINAEGAEFSMRRLQPRGVGKWPAALRGERFDRERKAYERAVDNALEELIVGKVSKDAIKAVKDAVEDLSRRLDVEEPPAKDQFYRDAKDLVRELRRMADILGSHKVERVLGEIDSYAGTTVNDLRMFMRDHDLRFGEAVSPEERNLYPILHEALLTQKMVMADGINPAK